MPILVSSILFAPTNKKNAKTIQTTKYFVNHQVTPMTVKLTDGLGKLHIFDVSSGETAAYTYQTKTAKKAICSTINATLTISAADLNAHSTFEFNDHVKMQKYHFHTPQKKQAALQKSLKTGTQKQIDTISSKTVYLA